MNTLTLAFCLCLILVLGSGCLAPPVVRIPTSALDIWMSTEHYHGAYGPDHQ